MDRRRGESPVVGRGGGPPNVSSHEQQKKKPTRRDYIFVNAQMLPRVKAFNIYWGLAFPVHAACKILLQFEEPKIHVSRTQKPLNLDDAIANAINEQTKKYHDKNEPEGGARGPWRSQEEPESLMGGAHGGARRPEGLRETQNGLLSARCLGGPSGP